MPEIDPKWLFLGVSGSLEPQGCSCWCKMVPGHWYTVPHYATALPGSIVDFKIPNLAKIWPEMAKKCSFWVVFWEFLPPRSPGGVQVGPRWWQATGILSHSMPQPSQVPLWTLKYQIWRKFCQKCSKSNHFGQYFGGFCLPGAPGVFKLVHDGGRTLVYCPTLCHSPTRFHCGL